MTFKSVVNIPIAFLKGVTVALVAALIVVVVGTVLFRVFNIVPEGSSELAILLFIWLIYLGAFVAFLEGGHLAITAVANRFHGRWLAGFLIISDAVLLFFLIILTTESYKYVMLALSNVRLTASLHISPAWGYSALLVGMGLSALYVAGSIAMNIRRLWTGEEPPHHSDEELEGTQV
ncbi:TRAP-type C4-dicarboxylate transport system, small permease component [Paramicrobacterium humi]|uniref:TRAP-type C4-dicarboxylate transport system, small permease component n=1 Tax=Paramicrobacterium humi TaxID=640635 RepID=A0A1H4L6H9_9MICO|nr:TRAP transporter small permease subunit [Microbacterium humi]SEB66347.1 TRAP-type C4-dicarboxylate transport system, small permease component [Microbacterium humi]